MKIVAITDPGHPDMPFFQALSTSLARLGPLDSAFMSGAQVRYHWLTYAWVGQVTEAARDRARWAV